MTAAQRALTMAVPTIGNHDQGSHFRHPTYTALLLDQEVKISMDPRGRAFDNIFTERLWRFVKYEEVDLHDYASPRDAYRGLTRYFTFYNEERLHHALEYCTPAEQYHQHPSTISPFAAPIRGIEENNPKTGTRWMPTHPQSNSPK